MAMSFEEQKEEKVREQKEGIIGVYRENFSPDRIRGSFTVFAHPVP